MRNENTMRTVKQLPAPRTNAPFATARFNLFGWVGLYRWFTLGTCGAVRAKIRSHEGDAARPDALLHVAESHGGRCRAMLDCFEGGPELIIEIANTTADEDLGPKRDPYRKFGVQEYIIWRVGDRALDWFVLRNKLYWPLDPGPDGIIRSEVFPGLWLDPAALLASDPARVLAVAQQGHGSPEHTAFVQELARRAANPV
jgi:hypothetical protein